MWGIMAGRIINFLLKGTQMNATSAAQAVDSLKGKIETFETQLRSLREDISAKRKAAGVTMFEGGDASELEDEITVLESKSKTLEAAKITAQTKLSEANENLVTAKRTDAEERIKQIRKEVDETANELEEISPGLSNVAQRFDDLLTEALQIRQNAGVSLSTLGNWRHYAASTSKTNRIDVMFTKALERFREFRSKQEKL